MADPEELDPEDIPEDPIVTKLTEVLAKLEENRLLLVDIKTNTGT